jgi:hypothetical protein
MTTCGPHHLDNLPINIKWDIVRGDTATLKVEFFENDETTYIDISQWDFSASAYDPISEVRDDLEVIVSTGYVEILAESLVTESWGINSTLSGLVARLNFDLQVITQDDITWTPVSGTINVSADVSGSTL